MNTFAAIVLAPFARWLYGLFAAIPIPLVRGGVFAILGALAVWVLFLPPQRPGPGEGSGDDLRFFALVVLVLQALLYIVF